MNNSNIYYVYIYMLPNEKYDWEHQYKPFYIGKGKGKRYLDHLTEGFSGSYLKYATLKKLKEDGLEPIIIKYKENISNEEAMRIEVELIKKFGRIDNETGILTNLTDGGDGTSGWICNESTRKKISQRNKNKIPWNKGLTYKDDDRIPIGVTHIWSDESREKASASAKKRTSTQEHKDKFLEIMKKPSSIENRRKKIIENGSLKGENNPIYGTIRPKETVDKIKKTLSKFIYTVYKDGVIVEDGIEVITDWARENNCSYSTILKSVHNDITISSGNLKGYRFTRKEKVAK